MDRTISQGRPGWFPDWSRDVCVIVGAGMSATPAAVDALRGLARVMVINTSWQLAPWADALYACDGRWWHWHDGVRDFAGIKVTTDKDAAGKFGLHQVRLLDLYGDGYPHRMVFDRPGVLGRGENGGFQALNLALQFGARRIGLLGIDFTGERWHGAHPNNPHRKGQSSDRLRRWRELLEQAAPAVAAVGADVVNLSGISALTAFPKMSFEHACARWAAPTKDTSTLWGISPERCHSSQEAAA